MEVGDIAQDLKMKLDTALELLGEHSEKIEALEEEKELIDKELKRMLNLFNAPPPPPPPQGPVHP